ncbi:MAG: DUF763 domain-containing protein [Euryarchaeota archaeon]|nr:DUF763 domain-containing protein [Euryarchaeota archaeon]
MVQSSVGISTLPLHGGHAPRWLATRMRALSVELFGLLHDEVGPRGIVERLSDPHWFQALSCVLAYDWHSSGTTTVVCGILKGVLTREEHGVALAGGKGTKSRRTPGELENLAGEFGLDPGPLVYASRMSAKVDSAAVQDGYRLYHHTFLLSRDDWGVVQQGMNPQARLARRYQWHGPRADFVEEPHTGILGEASHPRVLDMTHPASRGSRRISVDLVNDGIAHLRRAAAQAALGADQRTLGDYTGEAPEMPPVRLDMPRHVDWEALRRAYDVQPRGYAELLAQPGVGPAAVRALALVSDLLYGEPPSWRDPVRYTFAFGGKDGVPHPVNRKRMDEATLWLRGAIEDSRRQNPGRQDALRRLEGLLPHEANV